MYRLLSSRAPVRERRDQLRHPQCSKPELLATGPNQVWSWDITKLLGPKKWTYYYLYVIIDIYSRYAVGWMIADRENSMLASRLITETCAVHLLVIGTAAIGSRPCRRSRKTSGRRPCSGSVGAFPGWSCRRNGGRCCPGLAAGSGDRCGWGRLGSCGSYMFDEPSGAESKGGNCGFGGGTEIQQHLMRQAPTVRLRRSAGHDQALGPRRQTAT